MLAVLVLKDGVAAAKTDDMESSGRNLGEALMNG